MKKLFLTLCVLALMSCALADGFEDFTFDIYEGGARVTGYTGEGGEAEVDSEIQGLTVTAVADGAFAGNAALTKLTLPESVILIGDAAFMDCSALKEVVIYSSEAEIGMLAFLNCPPELVISAPEGSAAQKYAAQNSIAFAALPNSQSEGYAEALALFESGDYAAASEAFMALGDYSDSKDYYFYCSARVLEQIGNYDNAIVIYKLVPDFLDSAERVSALKNPDATNGEPQTGDIVIGGMLDKTEDEPQTGDIVIGGMLDKTEGEPQTGDIVIGGMLDKTEGEPQIGLTPDSSVVSYQEYSGLMPSQLDDYLATENYCMIYFDVPDAAVLTGYIELLAENGWQSSDLGLEDGWHYTLYTSDSYSGTFYIIESGDSPDVCFVYDGGVEYGFDPLEGLR